MEIFQHWRHDGHTCLCNQQTCCNLFDQNFWGKKNFKCFLKIISNFTNFSNEYMPFQSDLYFNRYKVRVIAVAPYFIETALNENNFDHWTNDEEAKEIIRKNAVGKPMLKYEIHFTGDRKLKKVQGKKLVKSHKSIFFS